MITPYAQWFLDALMENSELKISLPVWVQTALVHYQGGSKSATTPPMAQFVTMVGMRLMQGFSVTTSYAIPWVFLLIHLVSASITAT